MSTIDFKTIARRALLEFDAVVGYLLPNGRQKGAEYVAVNPTRKDDSPGSFQVNRKKGAWSDFATSDSGGDLISLWKYVRNTDDMGKAASELGAFLGMPGAQNGNNGTHKETWEAVLPVPSACPKPPDRHKELGTAVARYGYTNLEGELLCLIDRYEPPGKGKEFRPLSLWGTSSGELKWRWQLPPGKRPLYGQISLAQNPAARVLITEGEKACQAAGQLFPGFVHVTWPGGANSVDKADWSIITGRDVVLYPDADQPGAECMDRLARILDGVANSVLHVNTKAFCPPDQADLPRGYDAADALAAGWTAARVRELIDSGELFYARTRSEPAPAQALVPAGTGHLHVARATVGSYGAGNVVFSEAGFYVWTSNRWKFRHEKEVEQQIIRIFEALGLGADLTAAKKRSVMDLLKAEIFIRDLAFDHQDKRVINCPNGELYLRDDGWVLEEHKRDHYWLSQSPVIYDPSARAPRFQQFLEEIFEHDADRVGKAILLLEFLGYSLIRDCSLEKFLLLVGSGGNGKTKIFNVLAGLVGTENMAAVQPARFSESFQLANLQGKLVNLVPDLSVASHIDDGALKCLVSGELVQADKKFQPVFTFRPYAKHWFGSNQIPHTRDVSGGFFRRAIVIEFNRTFEVWERELGLDERLAQELPGILNMALNALAGVYAREGFTEPESCEEARLSWRSDSDQVRRFVDECCVKVNDNDRSRVNELYQAYREWAKDAGIANLFEKNSFSRRLVSIGYKRSQSSEHRYINGLRLTRPYFC